MHDQCRRTLLFSGRAMTCDARHRRARVGYHGPLQQLVMCACHRTSPTATLLACDGLYASTAAEQRGLRYTKLMTLMACPCASGATPPMSCTPARPIYWPVISTTQDRAAVCATRRWRRGNENSTEHTEADVARAPHIAAALAARA
jgi:hypothetical protein